MMMDSTQMTKALDHNDDKNDSTNNKKTKRRMMRKENICQQVSTKTKYNLRIKSSNSASTTTSSSFQQSNNSNRNNINSLRESSLRNNNKHKPPPLSKYRRKTANLRERYRMQEINDAFKRLQSVVPDIFSITNVGNATTAADECSNSSSSCSISTNNQNSMAKLTKINTLKLAVNYISALTQLLRQTETETIEQTIDENHYHYDKKNDTIDTINKSATNSATTMMTNDESTFSNLNPRDNCQIHHHHHQTSSNIIGTSINNFHEQYLFNSNHNQQQQSSDKQQQVERKSCFLEFNLDQKKNP
uniref:Helix-loop-helix protein delilah-like n=1 Tax=Dermatophagoides pteronyssinus TaxID=6956 RepID=A0A6P6Y3Y7_DERPT|nr:helix-loop-helix protein delilah-like [Dermatophagoides pteronyssinus]